MKFGHYDLLELLGRGGMGEVWKAHDTATDRVVAVKVLLPHFADDAVFQQRFRREAHAAAALQDPHVVPIHNFGVIDGRLYVDMRFVEGQDLHTLIVDGDLDPTRSVHIIEQVAMALESAHTIGLVHRDIKPANVLVGKYDFAYLIDFGIAVVTGQTALTNTGLAVGTWAYMAPERFGTGQSDHRTDIYALACVLFECLTKRSPFPGTDAQQVIVAHLTSDPPRVTAMRPELPAALDAVIARGMAKEPGDRFQSAIELAEAAKAAVIPPPAPPAPPPMRLPPPPSAPPQGPAVSRPPGPPRRPLAPRTLFEEPETIRDRPLPVINPREAPTRPAKQKRPPAPQAPNPSVNLGSAAIGLGVGTTNLVAMRDGRPAVTRKSVLTLYGNRSPEVGVPAENPTLNQPGLVLSSFVERVGDPVSLVAPDGSSHRADALLVEALDSLARTVGGGTPVTITVPSHWSPAIVESFRTALHGRAGLSPERAPATIIPDAGAALACLSADPGLPSEGVVVVCDIGGTGTNITLADAGAGLSLIGETVRHREFSGDFVDQTLLNHVIDVIGREHAADPAGTAAVASLTRLREDCRRAKEKLSTEPVAVVSAETRARVTDVRLERSDLERLIDSPVHALVDAVDDVLLRHRVPVSSVSTVALVGGGASIPLVAQLLSNQLGVAVTTTPNPRFANATGAVIAAVRGSGSDAATALSAADQGATSLAATMGWVGNTPYVTEAPATRKAPAEQVAGTPYVTDAPVTRKAAPEQVAALAWSEVESPLDEYTVGIDDYNAAMGVYPPPMEYAVDEAGDGRSPAEFAADPYAAAQEPAAKPWFKRTPMVFGAAAIVLLLTTGGIAAVTLTGDATPTEPEPTSTPSMVKPTKPPTSAPQPTTTKPTPPPPPKTTVAPPPPPITTRPPVQTPRPTRAPQTTYYTPTPEFTPEPTPEPTVEPTLEPTEPTLPTFPTVPTVPTLPPLFPEITLPPLFPPAPQP